MDAIIVCEQNPGHNFASLRLRVTGTRSPIRFPRTFHFFKFRLVSDRWAQTTAQTVNGNLSLVAETSRTALLLISLPRKRRLEFRLLSRRNEKRVLLRI